MLWPRRAGRPAAPVLLASVLTAALVGGAVALVAPLALAAPATVAELGESGAGAAAVASGRPVEATALRTERQQVVANPDGTFTVAANLTSASRFVSTSAKGAGTSVSAWPRHSASAALRVVEASALRPAARCSPALCMSASKRSTSSCSGPTRSRYPGLRVTISWCARGCFASSSRPRSKESTVMT
jgi:hypothetical protein